MNKNITIIIPIYNEKDNIRVLLEEIIKMYKWINILVVNDWSIDNVELLLKKINYKRFNYINNVLNKWLTYSIIKWIKNVNTNYFIVMDWDLQHPVKYINNFILLLEKWYDVVIWNRKNIFFKNNYYRNLFSKLWNILVNFKLWNNKIKDPLTWFFWGNTKFFINNISINKKRFINKWYKFLFEFLKCIDIKKIKIYNFYFEFLNRRFWKSKLWIREYLSFILWLIK